MKGEIRGVSKGSVRRDGREAGGFKGMKGKCLDKEEKDAFPKKAADIEPRKARPLAHDNKSGPCAKLKELETGAGRGGSAFQKKSSGDSVTGCPYLFVHSVTKGISTDHL